MDTFTPLFTITPIAELTTGDIIKDGDALWVVDEIRIVEGGPEVIVQIDLYDLVTQCEPYTIERRLTADIIRITY